MPPARRGIRCTIHVEADQARNRKNLGSRGGRPPKFDKTDYKERRQGEASIRRDGRPAPILWGNIRERLRERPPVACKVLGGVLPFAKLKVGRFHDDAGAMLASLVTMGANVLYAYHHRVRDIARTRGTAIISHIPDDDGTVAEPELRAVVLADPYPLDKPEGCTKPGDRRPHVGIDQNRDNRRRWDGAIRHHVRLQTFEPCRSVGH